MSDSKEMKLRTDMMQYGFKGGWAAAHLSLASIADEQGKPETAAWFRERANNPDRIEVMEVEPSEEDWTCPDCNGPHVPRLGGIRIGHPCPRTAPPSAQP